MSGQWRPGGNANHDVDADTVARVLCGALGAREACDAAGLAPEQHGMWARAFRRAALREFDEGLRRTLARQVPDGDELGASEFRGSIAELSISDLVQSLALARRDGVIALEHDGTESRLWCVDGEIVDAESGPLVAEAAVYRVLAVERGQLSAEILRVQRERRIERPTAALLLEAARREDERALLRGRFANLRFVRSPSAESATSVTLTQSALLALLDSPIGVADLLGRSGLEDYEALTELAALIDARRVDAMASEAPRAEVRTPSLHPAQSLRPSVTGHGVERARRPRRLLALALAAGVMAFLAWRAQRHTDRAEAPAPAPPVALAALSVTSARAPQPNPPEPSPPTPVPRATPLSDASEPPPRAAPAMQLQQQPHRKRPNRRATANGTLAADDRAQSSPRGTPERAPEPRVPRLRIIEEQVPQMQIVE
ncbi:MAG TPA: DUF4388 domain-containing protein [Polyangiaceae bacterium]|nr:DUF4388 domain-containing protein [Polyangiaceae bacterium]